MKQKITGYKYYFSQTRYATHSRTFSKTITKKSNSAVFPTYYDLTIKSVLRPQVTFFKNAGISRKRRKIHI